MGKSDWKVRGKHRVKPTRLPGIFKMEEGGHIARARVTDPTTGKKRELKKVFPQSNAEEVFAWFEAERVKVRAGIVLARPQRARFADYAISVFERKVKTGELKSAATQSKWRDILVHLVRGTHDGAGELAAPGFGELFVDQLRAGQVDRWKEMMGGLIQIRSVFSEHGQQLARGAARRAEGGSSGVRVGARRHGWHDELRCERARDVQRGGPERAHHRAGSGVPRGAEGGFSSALRHGRPGARDGASAVIAPTAPAEGRSGRCATPSPRAACAGRSTT